MIDNQKMQDHDNSYWQKVFWQNLPIYIQILNAFFHEKGYTLVFIGDCLDKLSFKIPKGLIKKEIKNSGKFQVISQSQTYSIGFSDREDLLIKDDFPLIVFGDHSKTIKFVDNPFIIGADGVKLLKPNDTFNERFFYYFLFGVITDIKDYGRHFSLLRKGSLVKIGDKTIQNAVVRFLDDLENYNIKSGQTYFDAEIEAKIIALQTCQLKINDKINQYSYQYDLLKKLRQQILQDAVQGKLVPQDPNDEPASVLLERIKAEKEKLVREKKIKKEKPLPPIKQEEIPFEIPNNWVWCRLGELCFKITDGFHNTPPKIGSGIPYISATHVKSDKIDWENCDYVAENFHRELYHKAYPQKGELLVVNIGAGCATPAIIDVTYEFSFKNTAILKFNQELLYNSYLFYYFLLSRESIYDTLTQGGLQPFLSLKILNNITLPLPPRTEQDRIIAKITQLMTHCDELEQSVQQNQKYTQELLQVALKEALEPKIN